jgi:apolipoprotein N-acyltransferase
MTMPRTARRPQTAAVAVTAPPRPRTTVLCLTASVISGILLWLCYFPADCGWLAWIALPPWLLLARAKVPNRRRYLVACLGALAFYIPVLAWMRTGESTMVYLWFLLALYLSWFFAAGLWLIRRLERRTRLPLTVTVPLVWVATEYVRRELFGGFAWYQLGHSQQGFLPAIQVADFAGVAGITLLVGMVNGLAAEGLCRIAIVRRWFGLVTDKDRPALRAQILAVAIALAAALGYGGWRLGQTDFRDGPRIALLQTSIPQTERNAADVQAKGDPLAREGIEQQDVALAKVALRQTPPPDLVILPETAFPSDWFEIAEAAPQGGLRTTWQENRDRWNGFARQFVGLVGVPTLLGLNAQVLDEQGKSHRYNTALLLTPAGEVGGRYDKIHLLPFGEYLPFKDSLPFVKSLSPYGDFDYSITPGEKQTRIPLFVRGRTYQLGVLICYEVADSDLTRKIVRPGDEPPADVLVNMTNDGWYMGSPEHAEHLAVSRFAAVECRRPLVRAVNGGISAVIDGNGRIVALPGPTWEQSHSVTGVVSAAVPLDERQSVYARLGDWLPWTCCGLVLVGCAMRNRDASTNRR